jgi:Tfp pilus assembly protein PilX
MLRDPGQSGIFQASEAAMRDGEVDEQVEAEWLRQKSLKTNFWSRD